MLGLYVPLWPPSEGAGPLVFTHCLRRDAKQSLPFQVFKVSVTVRGTFILCSRISTEYLDVGFRAHLNEYISQQIPQFCAVTSQQ